MKPELAAVLRSIACWFRLARGSPAVGLVLLAGSATGAESPYLTVDLRPDQTIREVAEQYLADADLWPEILKASGLAAITDLEPGISLRIPANEISTANQALVASLGQIQTANLAGAQVFAPQEIAEAIDLHEAALVERLERRWARTRELADESYDVATVALEKSEASRDLAAEALVSDRTGWVEGQRPEDLAWRNLQLRAILLEEEKVRTLSDSTAQITFRDASRLRLNENSNAVIQRMRYDPLARTQEAKVSLVEGDFYAVLSADTARKNFSVEIPDVRAVIDSGDFWVSNGRDGAKFANYDDREVRIEAQGETVNLGRNEGTVIAAGAGPGDKKTVLPPPQAIAPAHQGIFYGTAPSIAWTGVDGAAGYWLEVASDQAFNRLIDSRFGLDAPAYQAEPLQPGEYFWRAAALDTFGLPGERSATTSFTVVIDETPPFLRIRAPEQGVIVREARVEISGETEPGAKLLVDGAVVDVGADGRFETAVNAVEGQNEVVAVATDPAGNEIRRERGFVYMPDRASIVTFDPALRRTPEGAFLTNGSTASLHGTTTADAKVEIRSPAGESRAATASDGSGQFHINVPLAADSEEVILAVVAPSGFTSIEPVSIIVDRIAPAIELDELPPRLALEEAITLRGRTDADAQLTLNGMPVILEGGAFAATTALSEGANPMELIATDPAGNVTVEKWSVTLDRTAPELQTATLTRADEASGPSLMFEVTATDGTGLARAAPVRIAVGPTIHAGYLRYNRAARRYEGAIPLPAEAFLAPIAAELTLADDAGNERTFELEWREAVPDEAPSDASTEDTEPEGNQ